MHALTCRLHARRFRRLGELRTPAAGGGSGGALTLLARDEDTAQLVAIKLLRRGSADLDNAANEILNMRACAAHPFIVRFKQVCVGAWHQNKLLPDSAEGRRGAVFCAAHAWDV